MHVLVTGGTGHIGSYVIPELIAAGHEVTGLARSGESAAALSALGANVRRGDLSDLDGLKAAAAQSEGVIHLAHRQDLLPSGGINAVAAAELEVILAYGEALAGTGKPLVAAGSIGSPAWEDLGRPATEEDPALPGGDASSAAAQRPCGITGAPANMKTPRCTARRLPCARRRSIA